MKCEKCGNQISELVKFCTGCGNPIATKPAENTVSPASSPQVPLNSVYGEVDHEIPQLPRSTTANKNDEDKNNNKAGTKGCIGCIVVVIILAVIGSFVGKPKVKVSGDVAEVKVTLMSTYDLKYAAWEVAKTVYNVAVKNEDIKKIKVTVMMSSSGLQDNYGKPLDKDLKMGEIMEDDLEDIRKYRDADAYAYNDGNELAYMVFLKNMDYSHLLED